MVLAHASGADRAFERLYRRHALDVYRYAFGVLRNQADAEDVTQTTFLNAYRALERGERPEAPQHWLISIAHNVCRQRFRTAQRRVREVGLDLEAAAALPAPADDDAAVGDDVARALGHLAANQRAALVLRELEGRPYAEIAELLGTSVSAVETLIFRARRALREQLEGSLTCGEARQLLSRTLSRPERSQLRAHLRECRPCRTLARSRRAQRSALRSLFGLPWLGGGSAAVATKVAAVVLVTGVAGGLTGLLAPQAAHRTHRPTDTTATAPIEAAFVARRPVQHAAPAPAHRARRAATTRAAATQQPVASAPIHPPARPDDESRPGAAPPPPAPSAPPAAPPAPPAAPPAPQPSAPPAPVPAAPALPLAATTTATATTPTVQTPPLPAVPPVSVTVTVPSVPALTESSQNPDARNPDLGHLHP